MVLSSQLCMFKCQKQVETAAYSNHILSITLETTVYLNDSDKTKPITALKHFVSTQTSIKGLRKEWAEPIYLYLQLKCIKDNKVIRKLLINNNTRTLNKEDKALRTFVLQVGERIWKTYARSGSFHLAHCTATVMTSCPWAAGAARGQVQTFCVFSELCVAPRWDTWFLQVSAIKARVLTTHSWVTWWAAFM